MCAGVLFRDYFLTITKAGARKLDRMRARESPEKKEMIGLVECLDQVQPAGDCPGDREYRANSRLHVHRNLGVDR